MGILYSYIFGEESPTADATDVEQAEDPRSTDSSYTSYSNEKQNLPCSQNITTETKRAEIIFPPSNTPGYIHEVDKKNVHVHCAGKSKEFFIFPEEKISVLIQSACDWARKKPEKMHLVFEGEHLDGMKTVRSYPRLRGGSKVFLIYKNPHTG
ncbi:hypothetical protein AMEX_G11458 [Astyanax mexicanus]|uniref:Ubiquitin-like domain-containing protein n=1 Tax=Astyanax mexicanus TaxID=7994 RepID=A0A8T2LRK0_ASTMX|nr:hypothetical protein AMEX_G11458 [Astyanax mexicanus]